MKNFVFLSPNFPEDYWQFCLELKNNGLRVLGIGDCPYDQLTVQLKNVCTNITRSPVLKTTTKSTALWAILSITTVESIGWNPIMSIG